MSDKPVTQSAEQTRQALIRAGLKLFGEQGYEGTSTRRLAAAAGANIGSLASPALASAGAPKAPETSRRQLLAALERMVAFTVASPDAGTIVQCALRELSRPTSALDIVYDGVFEPTHRRLCRIWAAATGEDAESERTRITVFTMIGQVIYFRVARAAVLRRMGWNEVGTKEAAAIAAVAGANLMAVLDSRKEGRP